MIQVVPGNVMNQGHRGGYTNVNQFVNLLYESLPQYE
jgi:hypothetical protein